MTLDVQVFCKRGLPPAASPLAKYTVASLGKLHTVDKVDERLDYQKSSDQWEHVTFAYRAKPDYDRAANDDTDGKWENDWVAFFQYTPVPGGPPLNGSTVKDLSLAICSSIQKNINAQQNSKRIDWGPYGDNRTWNEVARMWVPRVPVIFFEKDRGNKNRRATQPPKKAVCAASAQNERTTAVAGGVFGNTIDRQNAAQGDLSNQPPPLASVVIDAAADATYTPQEDDEPYISPPTVPGSAAADKATRAARKLIERNMVGGGARRSGRVDTHFAYSAQEQDMLSDGGSDGDEEDVFGTDDEEDHESQSGESMTNSEQFEGAYGSESDEEGECGTDSDEPSDMEGPPSPKRVRREAPLPGAPAPKKHKTAVPQKQTQPPTTAARVHPDPPAKTDPSGKQKTSAKLPGAAPTAKKAPAKLPAEAQAKLPAEAQAKRPAEAQAKRASGANPMEAAERALGALSPVDAGKVYANYLRKCRKDDFSVLAERCLSEETKGGRGAVAATLLKMQDRLGASRRGTDQNVRQQLGDESSAALDSERGQKLAKSHYTEMTGLGTYEGVQKLLRSGDWNGEKAASVLLGLMNLLFPTHNSIKKPQAATAPPAPASLDDLLGAL